MEEEKRGIVSLLDILRAYAEAYTRAARSLTLAFAEVSKHQLNNTDVRENTLLLKRLRSQLNELLPHCKHLPMTTAAISRLLTVLDAPETMAQWRQTALSLMSWITDIITRLEDELSLNLFFKLPQDKKRYFDGPVDGWEDVVARFPETISNIEEMSKCFALSRYAATVFHAVRAIESGLLHLGKFLGVEDPKSGWTAVTSKLETLVTKTKYSDLSQQYKDCFSFLEQMHAVTQAVKSAWRNKISHAQGSLVLMTEDFTPDIAEEIMIASRAFMRRLATEMPY
jgi:hypothetical protein